VETALRILLADDDGFARTVMKDVITGCAAADTFEVEEGGHVLGAVEAVRPDVLFLDLFMPGRSGLELLGELRVRHPALPVVVVTGFDVEGVREDALRLGAHEYIAKPFHPLEVEAVLQRLSHAA
jgi:two-component system chemotaxis response regulator CheY